MLSFSAERGIPITLLLHYNLACYECQLGEMEEAKARLEHALKIDPGMRLMALDDSDLESRCGIRLRRFEAEKLAHPLLYIASVCIHDASRECIVSQGECSESRNWACFCAESTKALTNLGCGRGNVGQPCVASFAVWASELRLRPPRSCRCAHRQQISVKSEESE